MTTHSDPVCGMQVDDRKVPAPSTYEEQTYWFCSTGCKEMFDANPERYASKKVTV
jgi:Cu+-exporting ATPase